MNLFYRNRQLQLLLLTLVLVVVWGLSAFLTLPRLEDPEIVQRFARVTTFLPGATPERVETLVTEKIEDRLFELEEIASLQSTSGTGISVITVELKETVADVNPVWAKVRSKVDDAVPDLPTEASTPEYTDSSTKASALITGLTWTRDDAPNYAIMGRLAATLEDRLRAIPGTETVDEAQARRLGLDNQGIAAQLNAALDGRTGGSVLDGNRDIPVRVRVPGEQQGDLGAIASLDMVTAQGQLPLDAIASLSLVPDTASISRRNGQRINTVQGFITAGSLPSTVLAAFQQRLSKQGFELPPGYRIEYGGEADARGTAVGNLLSTVGVLTILMTATLVLSFNSFGLAALIGSVAILAVGLAALALKLFGSIFGFTAILGTLGLIGLAINDSIVVLAALREDPEARLGQPQAVEDVVFHATRHVIATTVTTVVGFVPLLLDPTGFWPPLAIAIAGGLGGATLLALYYIPSVYRLLARGKGSSQPVPPAVREALALK